LRARAAITVELGPAAGAWSPRLKATATSSNTIAGGAINLVEQIHTLVEQIRAATQDWLDALRLPVDAGVELAHVDQVSGPRFIDVAVIVNGVRCGFSKRQLALAYESSTRREVADPAAGVNAARALLAEAAANTGESLALAQTFLAELVVEVVKSAAERVITPEVTQAVLARARQESAAVRPAVKRLDQSLATEVLLGYRTHRPLCSRSFAARLKA
jgi:hypothetical protein